MADTTKTATNLDGWSNELTGIGDPNRDKTLAARARVDLLSGFECEVMWRGSDLGARIVETIPDEMTRRGWTVQIQPDEDDAERADADEPPLVMPAPKHTPGALPEKDDSGAAIAEALAAQMDALGLPQAVLQALQYERAYGGGAILIGADDGEEDLTRPLDMARVKSIRHLTAFRGAFDGECVARDWYGVMDGPKFGWPRTYWLRNIGVPSFSPFDLMTPPVPVAPQYTTQVAVHESRLLVFPGVTTSRWARVQQLGWGDSVFVRVQRVLSQYDQTWSGVANLMQDFAQGVLKIEGLAEILASQNTGATSDEGTGTVARRAVAMQMSRSIARTLILDATEDFSRETTPLSGIDTILQQFALRLAAAAEMPVTLLMGQAPAGLNATGASDVRFFYDRITARQEQRLLPQLARLYRIAMLAADSPTGGVEPEKWSIQFTPLWQESARELADLRKVQSESDVAYINAGVLTPEEVAVSRFGGSEYSTDTVLDIEGRKAMADLDAEPPADPPEPPPTE